MKTIILISCILASCYANPFPKIESSANHQLQLNQPESTSKEDAFSRSEISLEEYFTEYLKSRNINFNIPLTNSKVTLNAQNLDNEELNLKLQFDSGSEVQARKKSKIKKIFIPILIFILLKAMTLIPLALGILGIKTWNAIQLSFISFVSALALAVWKLCSKANHEPQIIHNAWDPHHHDRSDSSQLAYSGYMNTPQQ